MLTSEFPTLRSARPRQGDLRRPQSERRRAAGRQPVRAGFTLLELLVVIGIIAFLASLTGFMIANFAETAKEAATKTTLLKLNGMIRDRQEAFRRTLKGPQFERLVDQRESQLQELGIYGVSRPAVRVIVAKDLYRRSFPQLYTDIGRQKASGHQPETESAEMLYYMLTSMKVFGVPPEGIDAFNSSEVADTDEDGNLEFIDGWGQPLRWYRWPTRMFRPGGPGNNVDRTVAGLMFSGLPAYSGTGRDPLSLDPDDRGRALSLELRRRPQLRQYVKEAPPSNMSLAYYHTLETHHAPLVLSIGPDGNSGIFEPFDVQNMGHLAQPSTDLESISDNLTNHNQRAGG